MKQNAQKMKISLFEKNKIKNIRHYIKMNNK